MSLIVTNQQPTDIDPFIDNPYDNDFNPYELIKSEIAAKVFTPVNSSLPVEIKDDATQIDVDTVTNALVVSCDDIVQADAMGSITSVFAQTLHHWTNNSDFSGPYLFINEAATREKLPFPTATCFYTAQTDIIPVAKDFLCNSASPDKLFASFGFWHQFPLLGSYFRTTAEFDTFKNFVIALGTRLDAYGLVTSDTTNLINEFGKMKLNSLSETILLRANDTDNIEPYSFARIITWCLLEHAKITDPMQMGLMPFDLSELICPRCITFFNIDAIAHSYPRAVDTMATDINEAFNPTLWPKVVKTSHLRKATTIARQIRKAQRLATNARMRTQKDIIRAANIPFSTHLPTAIDYTKRLATIFKKMSRVNQSHNVFTSNKATFARPNRRNPDDFNKQGRITSKKYYPDLHIYIDTSGSISEIDYREAVMTCIKLAKRLNINLYFNSFSHILSSTYLLHTKDKSINAIYHEFKNVPKVNGGTDYQLVWDFINAKPSRERELSLMITDFEYAPQRSAIIKHPKNLYYAPCSMQNVKAICQSAKDFKTSMTRFEPMIRQHILF